MRFSLKGTQRTYYRFIHLNSPQAHGIFQELQDRTKMKKKQLNSKKYDDLLAICQNLIMVMHQLLTLKFQALKVFLQLPQ